MSDRSQRLTKRQQRLADKNNNNTKRGPRSDNAVKVPSLYNLHLTPMNVQPLTENQADVFSDYRDGMDMFIHGCPGTGKTFLGMYLALEEIYNAKSPRNKLIIIRSAQSSKAIGFLKGDDKQKIAVYEAPYRAHAAKLFGRDDAYDILKLKGIIDFQSTSFLRGTEYENAIVLIDEAQNLSYMELKTAVTRIGEGSRVIISGDTRQDDLTSERFNEKSGLPDLIRVLERMTNISKIQFGVNDIVRSGFVRDFIIAEYELGIG